MKKIIYIALAVLAFSSCRKASELPPLSDGYADEVILPDPENLTPEDREFLAELENEYENSTK